MLVKYSFSSEFFFVKYLGKHFHGCIHTFNILYSFLTIVRRNAQTLHWRGKSTEHDKENDFIQFIGFLNEENK